MKRFFIVLLVILMLPATAFAADKNDAEYDTYLNSFDFSAFDELDKDTKKILKDLGLFDFKYDSITSLSFDDVVTVIKNILADKLDTPLKSSLLVLAFIILSAFFKNFKTSGDSFDELYSTVSALIISVLLMVKISDTIALSAGTIGVVSDFIYAFVPAFCVIVAAGGGITTTFSTNATLLMLSQGLSFVSSNVFVPLLNCFLALGICSSLRWQMHLQKLITTAKAVITTVISFVCAAFVSVLSIKTAVAARADMLGLRSIRFAINTVVPVIGSSISEGLLSIQSYSSLIKSSVGVVGIVAVALVFLPAIVQVVIWRFVLTLCCLVSDIFDDRSVSMVLSAFRDTMLLINVILILSGVTTIISIGILVAAKTG